jgi:hypothetical protein
VILNRNYEPYIKRIDPIVATFMPDTKAIRPGLNEKVLQVEHGLGQNLVKCLVDELGRNIQNV